MNAHTWITAAPHWHGGPPPSTSHIVTGVADWLPDGYLVACPRAVIRSPGPTTPEPPLRPCAKCLEAAGERPREAAR
jgi:hypothetical protein